jgi:hypothetical protein
MQRTGSAGSFTGTDHVKVIDHALAQIPAAHRRDLLVTIDGAGASHEVIDHPGALNTARRPDGTYDRRGRRVEYSVGRPVDARTRSGIERLREQDRGPRHMPLATQTPGRRHHTRQPSTRTPHTLWPR